MIMKKVILFVMGIMFWPVAFSQDSKGPPKNNFMSLSFGPAIPLDNFASNDIVNNEKAGLAKNGISVNIQYMRTWKKLGLVSQVFYNQYGLDDISIDNNTISPDHWKLYGIMAGPAFITPVGKSQKVLIDVKAMIGAVNVNSPQFTFQGAPVIDQQWKTTFGYSLGTSLKYVFAEKYYGQFGIDYMDMSPKFSITSNGNSSGEEYTQHVTTANIHLGFGIHF
jgi:hypothetical protein